MKNQGVWEIADFKTGRVEIPQPIIQCASKTDLTDGEPTCWAHKKHHLQN